MPRKKRFHPSSEEEPSLFLKNLECLGQLVVLCSFLHTYLSRLAVASLARIANDEID